jgi:hypothetical protein
MVKKKLVIINGVKHGYIMCENDIKAPVVLYLHGGPGSPEYPIFQSQLGFLIYVILMFVITTIEGVDYRMIRTPSYL